MEILALFLDIFPLILVGLAAGFASGLIGIGGGMFYIILYTFFLERSGIDFTSENELVRMVISNSVLSTFFAALSASYKQYKLKNFYLKPVLAIGIPGLIGAIVLTIGLKYAPWYNRKVFAAVFTVLIIPLIWKMLTKPKEGRTEISEISAIKLTGIGLLSGAATALSGLGGAFILTPILNGFLRVNIQKVVSVAVGVIMVVALGKTIFDLFYQNYTSDLPNHIIGGIDYKMVAPVAIGILITAPLGVKVSKQLPEKTIKIIFVAFCALIIIRNILELIQ